MSLNKELDVPGIYILYYESDDFQYYIGKAINIRTRYKQHCRNLLKGKHKNKPLINGFNKYRDVPSIAVLEIVEDLDNIYNREIHWIAEFDSFNYGMNLTPGGEGVGPGEESPLALYTEDIYVKILEMLTDIKNTVPNIAKTLNVSEYVVSNISLGCSHLYLKYEHPKLWDKMLLNIGERSSCKYTKEDYIEVVQLLSEEYSLLEVAEITEIPYYIISSISRGVNHTYLEKILPDEYTLMRKYAQLGYRARKFGSQVYQKILELLAYTDKPYSTISEETGTNIGIVTSISIGKAHLYLKEDFPDVYSIVESKRYNRGDINREAQKIPRLFKHDNTVYVNIMNALANTSKKLNIIAKEFEVDEGVVEDISRGSTHRYLELEYPEVYTKMLSKKGNRRAGSQSGEPYPHVKDTEGNIYTSITNAKQFAIEHGLHPGHFGELLRGKAHSHKGWILA